jgi:proline iminopeptidase
MPHPSRVFRGRVRVLRLRGNFEVFRKPSELTQTGRNLREQTYCCSLTRMKAMLVLALLACAQSAKPIPSATVASTIRQPHEAHIPVEGAELYVREIGQGPAIIVLHGGPDFDHSYLVPELDRLSDSYHLIYYDQRGRGRSADHVHPEDVTLASDLSDLDKVREHFHLDAVTLLGHSWGTVLALEYALRYSQRVSRMILMNPAPASISDYKQLRSDWLEKRPADMEQRKIISASPAYQQGDPAAVTAYYRIHFKPAFARPENYEKFMTRLSASFTREGVVKARAVEARLMTETWSKPGYNLLPKLKTVTMPALVISGDHEFIPAATAEHISQALPNARLVTLRNCGHFTYLECPVPVHKDIDKFFQSK